MSTLDSVTLQLEFAITALQSNMPMVIGIVAGLYAIHILNVLVGYRLNILGIYPRRLWGLVGIAFSPFLHGNFNHLFFNSIPLFVLISFILLQGIPVFLCVSVIIILLSGAATWIIGRKGIHIGASGVIMGYWGYLLLNAYQQRTLLSVAPAVVCLYYFGGLVLNLFPTEVKTSWEAHITGFFAGLAAYYLYPYVLQYVSGFF